MKGNVPQIGGFLLTLGFLSLSTTAGQRSRQRHPDYSNDCKSQSHQRAGGSSHQRGPHIHIKYCDPLFGNHSAGSITKPCVSGFYRERTGSHMGKCVPCSCNGLSSECDEETGNCLKCQFNTDGYRCEHCKEGYYGNAVQKTCRECPCPFPGNSFALACLEISFGVVECLCKPGYTGAKCERCTHGYFGNPMLKGNGCQPCDCDDGYTNTCNSLTGQCTTPEVPSTGDHCHECGQCTETLLNDLEELDDELALMRKKLKSIYQNVITQAGFDKLEAAIVETKSLVKKYKTAVTALVVNIDHLEVDLDSLSKDVRQIIAMTKKTSLASETILENVTQTKLGAEDLVSETRDLFLKIKELLRKLSDGRPDGTLPVDEESIARLIEEAKRIVKEMRVRGCTAQRDKSTRERNEAQQLLEFINSKLMLPLDTNQALANHTLRSLMTSLSALHSLADALSNAEEKVDRAHGINIHSETAQRNQQKQRSQIIKVHGVTLTIIELIKDQLKNTTNLFGILQETKRDYEDLAGQQEGAKIELTVKLVNLSKASKKLNIVVRAEEHAEELDRMAKDFQRAMRTTVNRSALAGAMADLGAYTNILSAVLEAEMAANQSKEVADQALKDVKTHGLVIKAQGLKNNARNLLAKALETESDLNAYSHKVNSYKKHVDTQKGKGEQLKNNIKDVNDKFQTIAQGDIGALLNSTKAVISAATNSVNNVTDRLKEISHELNEIKLLNLTSSVDNDLSEAEIALKTLNRTWPVVEDNLATVQRLSKQLIPSANMSESVRRIQDMIAETRNFVIRLPLATTFDGKGHIELHPPSNLEDLKAFTAVDLLLLRHQTNPQTANLRRLRRQDKAVNMFVFYFGNKDSTGDYIGMAVRNNVLVCIYKLGGIVHEVETSPITITTNLNSTDFDRVLFYRTYQDAEVTITKNLLSENPTSLPPKMNLPNTTVSLLDLHPDHVVFYVGGHPDNFTPPVHLQYPKYRGAIKLSSVNDKFGCLFNYKNAVNMPERQLYLKVRQSEVSDYFEGTGYRMWLIKNPDKIGRRLFKFNTKSHETNALIFYIGNEESFYCVQVERGHIVIQGKIGNQLLSSRSPQKVSIFEISFAIVLDDKFEVHYRGKHISVNSINAKYQNYYIGGLPAQLRIRDNITAPPLRGCVDHISVDAEYVQFNKTIGVRDGCPASLLGVRVATLNPGGSLSMDPKDAWAVTMVSLGFRSTERDGNLVHLNNQEFKILLVDGHIIFSYAQKALKSNYIYNDGRWHYLSAVRNDTVFELCVDNVDHGREQSQSLKRNLRRGLVLGGDSFSGCISNLHIRRPGMSFVPYDLSSSSPEGDVLLGTCSPVLPQETMPQPAGLQNNLWHRPQKYRRPKERASNNYSPIKCRLPTALHSAHHFSGHNSWLSYHIQAEDLNHRPHFSLEVRTRSSDGLLFHVAGVGEISLVALYMSSGQIKLSLGQGRVIHHKRKSNDGNWHRVMFSVEANTFHLVVDGFRVTDGVFPNNEGSSLNLQNPVFLGSHLDNKTSLTQIDSLPKKNVVGCIRQFRLNEELVGEPAGNQAVSPCFDGPSESGTYFAGKGGHIVLDKFFDVGSRFELTFEVRPRDPAGLLFHVKGHHNNSLNVFLGGNKVTVQVNDGSGYYSVSVTPLRSLCDGTFHSIKVSKQNNLIKLEVDSQSQHTMGPTRSSYSMTQNSLYIGGSPDHRIIAQMSWFIGCMRNVRWNGNGVALNASSGAVVGLVNANGCPAD